MITMSKNNSITKAHHLDDPIHLIRHRLNTFLTNAVKNPVITVCARTGCGKTRSVSDFLRWRNLPFLFLQLGEADNSASGFWDNIIAGIMHIDTQTASRCREIGFPDTEEKTARFIETLGTEPLLIVCDDFHALKERAVLEFMERLIKGISSSENLKILLSYYNMPAMNIDTLHKARLISEINETDLNFTEIELANCLKQQHITVDSHSLRDIFKDTGGWAFAVNLAVRSLKRIPKYNGFVKTRLKPNIFEYMESENWRNMSEDMRHFLVRISLVNDHYEELIGALTKGGDRNKLLAELKQQNDYIKFDSNEKIYFIHHIYLEFLREKQQKLLENDEMREIYTIETNWRKNNTHLFTRIHT
jgi:LuxR family maltose regulon positive regulatory protein